jgi:hypothetical protein
MADSKKKKVSTSAPGAISGKVPVTPKKVENKSKSSSGLSSKQRAAVKGLGGITKSLGSLAGLVEQMGADDSGGGLSSNASDSYYTSEGRTGTSSTGQRYIKGEPVSEKEFSKFLGAGAGGSGSGGNSNNLTDIQTQQQADRRSAYDLLMEEFDRYGLGSLVENIKGLVQENVSPSEFAIRLRQTDAYKKRFAANAQRIAQGLGAISEAEYIGLEDQYQNIMRQYGLPATYYTKGDMGRQEGFEKFIANDISAVELEDRIATAQNRVINANPEV